MKNKTVIYNNIYILLLNSGVLFNRAVGSTELINQASFLTWYHVCICLMCSTGLSIVRMVTIDSVYHSFNSRDHQCCCLSIGKQLKLL